MAQLLQLRVPVQAVPVDRSTTLQPYLVDYGAFRAKPEADPQPDIHAHFSSRINRWADICPVLSDYAVARCFV
jgi:hypothetical protein